MSASAGPERVKAAGVRWDLSPIHRDPAEVGSAQAQLLMDAEGFRGRWQGRVGGLDPAQLSQLLDELSRLTDRHRATAAYCELRYYADSSSAENQDLRSGADEAAVRFANLTRFFELEWQAIPAPEALALAATGPLPPNRHFLERLTEQAAHRLSAEVEDALAERSTAAVSAWQQLFAATTSAITVEFSPPGEAVASCTISELLAFQRDQRSEVRAGAMNALFEALEPWSPVLARAYDTLVGDRLGQDRLRGFVSQGASPEPLPMQQANLANELPDAVVDNLLEAVGGNYGIAQRYFRIKAKEMGLRRLRLSDQYAPLGEARHCGYDEAQELVLAAMRRFSPEAEQLLSLFFSERRIDAEPRPGKQGGAFCESVAQDRPAYVLLNYTDLIQDAGTLAHELGHGLHMTLAKRRQGPLMYESGLGMAEVASTFNELLLFDHQLDLEPDREARRKLTADRVERAFLTIFSQTMMARYEQRAYAAKSRGESLNPERLGTLWSAEADRYFGDAVERPEGARLTWAYIPHFIYTRFYTYSYAFAHLVSLRLYLEYLDDRSGFVPRYFDLLGQGGARPPAELLSPLGIDLLDPGWVNPAFALINSWIDQVEAPETGAGPNRVASANSAP